MTAATATVSAGARRARNTSEKRSRRSPKSPSDHDDKMIPMKTNGGKLWTVRGSRRVCRVHHVLTGACRLCQAGAGCETGERSRQRLVGRRNHRARSTNPLPSQAQRVGYRLFEGLPWSFICVHMVAASLSSCQLSLIYFQPQCLLLPLLLTLLLQSWGCSPSR